jgi:hypothetical protein
VHHDSFDYDLTTSPKLLTVKHDGKMVDIVAVAGKNGFLYVFDRVTGKPIWPIVERPVPQSAIPGEPPGLRNRSPQRRLPSPRSRSLPMRFWSHLDDYFDSDPYGPAVLYWYKTVRNPKAPGGAELVPHLIHNRSGAGSDVLAVDLNGDGRTDIVTSTRSGTYIFWGKPADKSTGNK